jgi:Domain of unknown function (DUF4259)
MGAWGSGPFENDDAGDWVYDLEGADDFALVRDALDVAGSRYLDAGEGAAAVAAAVVVAAAFDPTGVDGVPEAVTAWLDDHARHVDPGDRRLATAALDRVVGERSELAELWDEAPDGPAWREGIATLKARPSAG